MHSRILTTLLAIIIYQLSVFGDETLPPYVDNSTSEHFPPVISQQGGSCAQAAGVGYMFTYEMNRALNRNASLSADNRFSYLYTWNYVNEGIDSGGFVTLGLTILKMYGGMTESDFGTNVATSAFQWASGYDKYLNAMRYRVDEIITFDAKTYDDLEIIKSYLHQKGDGISSGGVVTFSMYSSGWGMNNLYDGASNSGYKSILTSLASTGAHAITIAGYDDDVVSTNADGEERKGAFIVVNSWGSYMHDRGRFYIPYYLFVEREENQMESVLSTTMTGISVTTHQPTVVMKVQMSYSSRNDIQIQYGITDKYTSTTPLNKQTLSIMRNQGGDHPLLGEYSNDDDELEFAVDFTPLISGESNPPKYLFNVIKAQNGNEYGDGRVTGISILDYRQVPLTPIEYSYKGELYNALTLGENYFTIMPYAVSASRYQYNNNTISTYNLRLADGGYSKIEIDPTEYKNGVIKVRYNYNLK